MDDIVIVAYNNDVEGYVTKLFQQINTFFENKRLSLHKESDHDGKYYVATVNYGKDGNADFDYLGYHISLENDGKVSFSLSGEKYQRYIDSINRVFSFYADHAFVKPNAGQKGEKC